MPDTKNWRIAMMVLTTGAGIVATALFCAIIYIVWKGGWTPVVEALRVGVLAKGAIAMAVLMGASMIGILVAGPLSRITGKVGSVELEVAGDREDESSSGGRQ